jgi:hypothetical protein
LKSQNFSPMGFQHDSRREVRIVIMDTSFLDYGGVALARYSQ